MRIARLSLRNFRNYDHVDVTVNGSVIVVHGAIGAGKSNLLEAVYLACVGRSCRTSDERELVRFGEPVAHVEVVASTAASERRFDVVLRRGRGKVVKADGVATRRLAEASDRPHVCVFMPDRLELVKGAAGGRRAHLDAFVAALWPSRRETRLAYGRTLGQRNSLLARIRAGAALPASLRSWDHALGLHGIELMRHRREAVELLAREFAGRAGDLGLPDAEIRYRPRLDVSAAAELEAELRSARAQDLERGFSTRGPHRDDLRFEAGGRDLRRFGSQGQQRLGLLALLLAERDVLEEALGDAPLLLLDDVLSELDASSRERLAEAVVGSGQTLITTADPRSMEGGLRGASSLLVREGTVTCAEQAVA